MRAIILWVVFINLSYVNGFVLSGCLNCQKWEKCIKDKICFGFPCPRKYKCLTAGVCPKSTTPAITYECFTDSQCSGLKRCCLGKCMDAVPITKPGRCPKMSNIESCHMSQCKNDMNCPGNQKCCGLCRRCHDPESTVKPGICPTSKSFCFISCKNDDDCFGRNKCCGNCCKYPVQVSHCQPKCTKTEVCKMVSFRYQCKMKEKDGKCPTNFNMKNSLKDCKGDNDCMGDLKCCRNRCTHPKIIKPGWCPNFKIICSFIKFECGHDGECPLSLKCCNWCGRRCVKPRNTSNICPYVKPTATICFKPIKALMCNEDSNCVKPLKCCKNKCGFKVCTYLGLKGVVK